jgi:hypothetical protein
MDEELRIKTSILDSEYTDFGVVEQGKSQTAVVWHRYSSVYRYCAGAPYPHSSPATIPGRAS